MLPSLANGAAHTDTAVNPARYETVILDGTLYSDLDFEEEQFVTIGGMHFFYIRTALAGSGYACIRRCLLEDVGKSKLLKAGEELRNGDYQVDGKVFTRIRGLQSEDGEWCPFRWSFPRAVQTGR
ncbi:MAG: hypothetical protein ABSF15_11705 [Candidatus Sulfotelmatobacter sp.]|jgi:hypothetical protein